MIFGKKVLAIIPARSGSKEIKNKNILKINNIPLINYSLIFTKKIKFVDKIIVSTDSKKYQKIVNKVGNFSKFLRPAKISKDSSHDIDFIMHALNWLKKKEDFTPDLILHLRPTSPLRKIKDITKALKIVSKFKNIDSLKSVNSLDVPAEKLWIIKKNKLLKAVFKNKKFKEAHNMPRQLLSTCYKQNALFDIYKTDMIKKKKFLHGENIFGFITSENLDIDNRNDIKDFKSRIKSFKQFIKYIEN